MRNDVRHFPSSYDELKKGNNHLLVFSSWISKEYIHTHTHTEQGLVQDNS